MRGLTLITLSSLVNIAIGHVSVDGSRGKLYQRVVAQTVNGNDINNNNNHQHRALSQGSVEDKKLQQSWWNWNFCTNAYPNASFTPTNRLVPNNTVFLALYPTFQLDDVPATCQTQTITRRGTIKPGQQTIFFPVRNDAFYDFEDDFQKCNVTKAQILAGRLAFGTSANATLTNTTTKANLYLNIDGKVATPTYVYDATPYYFRSCDDNRTYEEYYQLLGFTSGDTCDNTEYQAIGGLDSYPMLGWYGKDIRVWADGETHTYEFGSKDTCITAKYILTAKTGGGNGGGTKKCGLFGLGLFCPLEWLNWLFNLFT